MESVRALVESHMSVAWIVMAVAFVVLAKCADLFVDSAVALAKKFKIPRLVIGIVLVSLATTAPELAVSLMSALRGSPEMALGNAIGSVICDDGLALALCGVFSVGAISIIPHALKISGVFLLIVEILAFVFVWPDMTLSRWEGAVLLGLFVGYMIVLFHQHRAGRFKSASADEAAGHEAAAGAEAKSEPSLARLGAIFAVSLAGIVISSEFIITSARTIALSFGIPDGVVALTLVALGTSIPEVATCITAARKGEGELAVGNILGADIMNICWVAGVSAMANELTLTSRQVYFMFPWMFVIVGLMLAMLWKGYSLTRRKGLVLFAMYVAYLISFFFVFPPQ